MYPLARAVDEAAHEMKEPFVVQAGSTDYDFKNVKAYRFLDRSSMRRNLELARVVVSHGGWGTMRETIELRKPLVAVPRKLGIEVNHSQEELVLALGKMGCLIPCMEPRDLAVKIRQARCFVPASLATGNADGELERLVAAKCRDWFG